MILPENLILSQHFMQQGMTQLFPLRVFFAHCGLTAAVL